MSRSLLNYMKIGIIEVSGRTIACLIRNKSETGAALEVVFPPPPPPLPPYPLLPHDPPRPARSASRRNLHWGHQLHSDMADQEVDRRQIPSGIDQRKYHTRIPGTTKLGGPSATFSRYIDFALGFGRGMRTAPARRPAQRRGPFRPGLTSPGLRPISRVDHYDA